MIKYSYGKYVAGSLTNYKLLDSTRIQKQQQKIRTLKERYNLNQITLSSIGKYESANQTFKENNLIKIANMIHEILICYGYTEEEITAFMIKNKTMFNSYYDDFRYRLALMYKFGLFEKVFFKYSFILTRVFTDYYYGTKTLYSVLLRNEAEGIQINEKNLTSISKKELIDIKEKYKFDMEKLKEYDNEMLNYLKNKKIRSLITKRKI